MRRPLLACALAAVLLAGCGEESGSESGTGGSKADEAAQKPKPSCRKAPKVLVDGLEQTLTAQGDGRLQRARYVHVENPPEAPLAGFRPGVYVVSARLAAPGTEGTTLSWAVSRDMLRSGGGLGLGMDEITREFSDLGAAANPGSPAADYTDTLQASNAYEQSRACAEGS